MPEFRKRLEHFVRYVLFKVDLWPGTVYSNMNTVSWAMKKFMNSPILWITWINFSITESGLKFKQSPFITFGIKDKLTQIDLQTVSPYTSITVDYLYITAGIL